MFLKNKKITLTTILFLIMLSFNLSAKPIGVYKDISNNKWKDTPMVVRKVLINLNLLNKDVNIFDIQWLKEIKTRYELYGLTKNDLDWVNAVLKRNKKTWVPRNDYTPKKQPSDKILTSDDSHLIHETEEEKKNAPVDLLGRKKEKDAETSRGIRLKPTDKEMTMQGDILGKHVKPVKIYTGEDLKRSVREARQMKRNTKEIASNKINNKSKEKNIIDVNQFELPTESSNISIKNLKKMNVNDFNSNVFDYINYNAWLNLKRMNKKINKYNLENTNLTVDYDFYNNQFLALLKEKKVLKEKELLKIKEIEKANELKRLEKIKQQKLLEQETQNINNNKTTRTKKEILFILTLNLILFVGCYLKIRGKKC